MDAARKIESTRSMDAQVTMEAEVKHLRQYVDAGQLEESDLLIIVGTRIYGHTLAEVGQLLDLEAEATKKRRQRAEARIQRIEKKRKKSCPRSGPRGPFSP
jgi:hypothetical protein